ncbi:MAG: GGDEF domain-containing protein [Trueperaceae bacterium]|nr:GGDEF domain-containing protein [Trueperaceae bacterium]
MVDPVLQHGEGKIRSFLGLRLVGTGLIWLAYILSFLLLVPLLKEPTGILVLIPIIVSSWLWGMRKGAALALFGAVLNAFLYLPTGLLEHRVWIVIFPGAMVFGVGLMVGYLQDLRQTLKRQNDLISYHADHDSLTGLLNRNSFGREAGSRLEQGKAAALLYIDLDGFKAINDNYGHATGDHLLIKVAERLTRLTRKTDLQARLGGDEFAILLTQVSREECLRIGQHVLEALAEPYDLLSAVVLISASIGISVAPQDGKSLEELLKKADRAMYRVKEHGKNGLHFSLLPADLLNPVPAQ